MKTIQKTISTLKLAQHIALTIIAFIAFRVANTILDASYARSQFPVPYQTGQTAFDGELIKSYYQFMIDAGTLDIYWQTQLIDFTFIAALFSFGLTMPLLVRRLFRPKTRPFQLATLAATIIPLGALFDTVENLISFVMLAQPQTFPNWLAPIYSSFAVLKFGSIATGYVSVAASLILFVIFWMWQKAGIERHVYSS